MDDFQLDYSDVSDIFKEKLKIDNIVKTIDTIFNNERYFNKINYMPYFQRNYVWDDEKATYFIESILLGTEIPPLVLFQTRTDNEVIDGRQRFETIDRFLNDKFILKGKGLHSLKQLNGKKFSQLDEKIRTDFMDTRIRILQFEVVNEPRLDELKEDKIKKEIFRRYNSGITPLQKYDIERAIFIDDPLTNQIMKILKKNKKLFLFLCDTILPKSKKKSKDRDKINVLLTEIRELITLQFIPIYDYAQTSKIEIVRKSYFSKIANKNPKQEVRIFLSIIDRLQRFYASTEYKKLKIKSEQLFFTCLYWIVSIIYSKDITISDKDIIQLLVKIRECRSEVCWNKINNNPQRDYTLLFEQTGSHYYGAVMNRFTFFANIFGDFYNLNLSGYLKFKSSEQEAAKSDDEYSRYKINKALPETLSIEDIMREIEKSRFLIRPNYQRSETTNSTKASYLMESVLLGIKIPPLFVYKRCDNVKEVVDGQQRLLTLIGYLGENYLDENGITQYSDKNKFKLKELKILKELKGKDIDQIPENFKNKILDFPMDIIEIDGAQNPDFSAIDLFLRLNTKPYPIKENTFEMWNAYLDKRITMRAKELANKYEERVFRPKDSRMKVEELVTSLAYIDYKINMGFDFNSVFCFFIRDERLCARIMSKAQMTKQLIEMSAKDPEDFLNSLNNVENFAEKLLILTNGEKKEMKKLVNHSRAGTAFKTDQNFYYLWLILKDIELSDLEENKYVIFSKIKRKFEYFQNISNEFRRNTVNELFVIKK